MSENNIIIEKIKVMNEIDGEIKRNIKLLYVFNDLKQKINVILVTNEDNVYCFGNNSNGVLGFGHNKSIKALTINKELSNKNIFDIKSSNYHTIACNIDGNIFCWGCNRNGCLGNGNQDQKIYKPEKSQSLINEKIIGICCGSRHTLVLTSNKEVYAWGGNQWGQIGNGSNIDVLTPTRVIESSSVKVKTISCGFEHSMALAENGKVLSWGKNERGQLGRRNAKKNVHQNSPAQITINELEDVIIKKICCGKKHSLLLSRQGDIYAFGSNHFRQLGVHKVKKRITPFKLKNKNKFTDIAANFRVNISIASSEEGILFIWGECGKTKIDRPLETKCKSFHEVFANYFETTYHIMRIDGSAYRGVGRYNEDFKELNFIAKGSYGIVFKVMIKESQEIYAIKKIPINEKLDVKALREINIWLKLKSDYIVKLEDFWIEENYLKLNDSKTVKKVSVPEVFDQNKPLLLHIQMDFCEITLKDAMKKVNDEYKQKISEAMKPLGYSIASELFIEILESVNFLHKQKVIHRDLKPSNILLKDGNNERFIKIADFGLATIHEYDEQSHTKYKGAERYAAPEVLRGKRYDTKVDIYSLGVIVQDLFNIDINEPIGEKTALQSKYSAIFKLAGKMLSAQKNNRPDSEIILNERHSWALSLNDYAIEYKKRKSYEDLKSFYFKSLLFNS